MSEKEDAAVSTDQISVACYLAFRGNELLSAEWLGTRCTWKFSRDALPDKLMFDQGKARVDPAMYFEAVGRFKRQTWNNDPRRS